MLRALRAELNALLADTPVRRKPALRRSDVSGALLATDLPFASEADDAADFCRRAQAAGWQVRVADNGWQLLDKAPPVPQTAVPQEAQGECGCCLSLLLRHPETGEADETIRRVLRAEEAGWRAFDRLCAQLHAELAAMLRCRQPLPGALTPYLAHAYQTLTDGRK